MTSVFWTSTSTPTDGIDPRERFDGQHGVEERGAGAAVALGDLDAHDAELEQLVDELAGHLGVLVHLADERPDLAVGEFVDAVAEQRFVFGQTRQRRAGRSVSRHVLPRTSFGKGQSAREALERGMVSSTHAAIRRRGWSTMRRITALVSSWHRRCSLLARMEPARPQAQPAPAPSAQPPPAARRRRRPRPDAGAAPASRRRRAAGVPHRHQLRARRRHRHRQAGQAGHRSQAGRFRSLRGRQAADGRDLPAGQDRRGRRRSTHHAAQIRTREDEETAAANENARIFVLLPRRLPRAAGQQHVGRASRWSTSSRTSLAPSDLVAVMYPLTPLDARRADARSRRRDPRDRAVQGRKFDYEPRNDIEQRYAHLARRDRRADSAPGVAVGAEGAGGEAGRAARGPQGDHLRQRGLHGMLPPQLRDPVAGVPGLGNPRARQPARPARTTSTRNGRAIMAEIDMQPSMQRRVRRRQPEQHGDLRRRSARAGDGRVRHRTRTVGPRQSRRRCGSTLDSLRMLAENTDGRAIVNRNDLAKGMKQIVRDSSAYYLLGYNSTQAPQDGKFHEITRAVKRPRRPGPRPQGLLGATRPTDAARVDRAAEGRSAAGGRQRASPPLPPRAPAAGSSAPGWAPHRARTARRG